MPLHDLFEDLRSRGRKALIPYVTAGFPDSRAFVEILHAVDASEADVVEVGIPFSDPMADGPAIQAASERALAGGASLARTLDLLATARLRKPVVLMSYLNLILQFGFDAFARTASAGGVAGVVVPDLPLEESPDLDRALGATGIDLIGMIAPTTPEARIRAIASRFRGFLYLISRTGVTGTRRDLGEGLGRLVRRARSCTDRPICVGFGISTPAQAAEASKESSGVIIGSALIELIGRSGTDAAAAVGRALTGYRGAIDGSTP